MCNLLFQESGQRMEEPGLGEKISVLDIFPGYMYRSAQHKHGASGKRGNFKCEKAFISLACRQVCGQFLD